MQPIESQPFFPGDVVRRKEGGSDLVVIGTGRETTTGELVVGFEWETQPGKLAWDFLPPDELVLVERRQLSPPQAA